MVLASTLLFGDPAAWRDDVAATGADAARGGELFAKLPCASCHNINKPWPGGEICPNLGNIASEAARIIKLPAYRGAARDAAGYIRESITNPNAYIVPGPNYRTPQGDSVMPKDFLSSLPKQDLDDLVAFLMTKR
jgi:nitric oxide reductase subunit C